MAQNSKLHRAKKVKNDEFYTFYEHIEKEVKLYKDEFVDKVVYLNCDNPQISNFYKFFTKHFKDYQLKKLIITHYNQNGTYKLEFTRENDKGIVTQLKGDGDFRSIQSTSILEEADIVVTNPPFSLFNEFINQLISYNKKFLIIGGISSMGSKNVFNHIKNNKIWLGTSRVPNFFTENDEIKDVPAIWYTNLKNKRMNEFLELSKFYNDKDYPKYLNRDVINVDRTVDIPKDYNGLMGVPITFLEKYNPLQFEIIELGKGSLTYIVDEKLKNAFTRIIIRKRV